ncbi:MAG: hypothetical protein ACE5ED_00590 [Rhodothalassiaceae bacterium]
MQHLTWGAFKNLAESPMKDMIFMSEGERPVDQRVRGERPAEADLIVPDASGISVRVLKKGVEYVLDGRIERQIEAVKSKKVVVPVDVE